MSTKILHDIIPIVTKLLNGGFAILLLVGFGVWGLSNMSTGQVDTLARIVALIDNPLEIVTGIKLLLWYVLVVYPAAKYFSVIFSKYNDRQADHYSESAEHHAASKQMFRCITDLQKHNNPDR